MREGQRMEGRECAEVLELKCNLDDMTPEEVGFAMEELLAAGALDVWTESIGMKKCRPGVCLNVLTTVEERETMLRLLFRLTTTLGVRESRMNRYSLDRKITCFETPEGPVHMKESMGFGTSKAKAEYDDLAKIARQNGVSIREALDLLRKALKP